MRPLFIGVIFLVFLLLNVSCRKNKEYTVEGIVNDGNVAVASANVQIDELIDTKVSTDQNGYFIIENAPRGTHNLVINKGYGDGGYVEKKKEINIEDDINLSTVYIPNPVTLSLDTIISEVEEENVQLSWTKSTAQDFYEYKLYRHTTSGLDETTGTLLHVATDADDTLFTDQIPHNASFYYRVYVNNTQLMLGGSNILNVQTGLFQNNEILALGQLMVCYLAADEHLWFYFNGTEGSIYKVAWYDSWWTEYTAGSIFVTGYRDNKTEMYFLRDRLIQMVGSPKTLIAKATEKVYLYVEGYNSQIEGSFAFKIDQVDKASATIVPMGDSVTTLVSAGELKLFSISMDKDSVYRITMTGDKNIGAYGDNIHVNISAFGDVSYQTYFYEEYPGVIEFSGSPNIQTITSAETETLYILVVGAYWWYPRTVKIGAYRN
ncbi:MAG: hypothetical protein ABIJ16_04355 [Bacteroidota bacterium]